MESSNDLLDCFARFPQCKAANIFNKINAEIKINSFSDESSIKCRRCKTPNPLIWQRQTRSADEAMTVFFLCKNIACGNRWKE